MQNRLSFTSRSILAILVAGVSAIVISSANATMVQGNPYTPPGADFDIFALQGITPTNSFGDPLMHPQVNTDFEFTPSIGVSWDQGNGHLKDFGLGLFQDSAHNTFSTGMNVQYHTLVNAFSVSITLQDFDIKLGDPFFNKNKVEPGLMFLGADNSIYASLTPHDIFPYMHQHGSQKDVWDISFADLLNAKGLSNVPIKGFVLYADMLDGEKANSDPYLFLGAGNGTPVPEAGNYLAGLAAILFALIFQAKQLRRKQAKA